MKNKNKLTVNTLALGNLKQRKKQYTILIVGIVLAMVFSSGVPFFVSCMKSSQIETMQRRQGKQDFIIINAQNYDFSPIVAQNVIDSKIGYCHTLCYAWNEEADYDDGTMIGWLDEIGEELYYPNIVEGRMPETDGEIAVEKSALQRMRFDTKIGETITLKALVCNGSEFLDEVTEKVYTLVGILSDKKANIEHIQDDYLRQAVLLPAAFVSNNTQPDSGGKEGLVAFVKKTNVRNDSVFYDIIPFEDQMFTNDIFSNRTGDVYSNIVSNTNTLAFFCVLLAFLSCFGIANTFNSNLKERKTQVGMLKAVGATRRQIINIFGREAFIICTISAPLSVALSYGGVKFLAKIMGENFVFKPNFSLLLISAFFGIVCVMLSALIPVWSISKLPPMQAIRDIELMRKMKNRKIKSQFRFNVSRLLAKRKLTFSRARQRIVCSIICLSIVICCVGMSFLFTTIQESNSLYSSDYEIFNHGMAGASNTFINYPDTNSLFTESKKYEIYDIPQVENVYGYKLVNANIVFKDGIVPEYLQINEYVNYSHCSSRFINANDVQFLHALEEFESGKGSYNPPANIKVTAENVREFMQAGANPDYVYTKQAAGFTSEELFNVSLSVRTANIFTFNKDDIIDGEINLDKINAGEEVVICAPEKIGFVYEEYKNGYSSGIYNLANATDDMSLKNNIKDEAESPFRVGDTITLSIICSDANGKITREDRDVKIGAIVGKKTSSGTFCIYTTVEALDTFDAKFNYIQFDVELKEECTAEIDAEVQSQLSAMFPGKQIGSAFAWNEVQKQEFRTVALSVVSLVLVLLFVCISLINNSVSAQIREGKRFIGTLRAVGASQRELILSYLLQIADMLLWGFGTGIAVYVVSYSIIGKIITGEYFPVVLWPAFLVFGIIALSCYINLRAKIRSVTNHSIVENIREL